MEQVQDARSMVILVPNELQRSNVKEAEFVLPRSAAAVSKGADATTAVSSVRALVDLKQPNRFHRDLLRDLALWPGATLLDVSLHWQKVFSVERVTTRFYQEYMKVRDRMAEALLAHNADHPVVGKLTIEDARAWATRQMGRMLFLWFLQSKKWLGEPGGMGYPDYLLSLWNRRDQAPVQEYYRGLLVPLFFEGMALGTPSQAVRDLLGYTPYLNGGLFRKNRLEDAVDDGGEVSIPDEVFDPDADEDPPRTVLGLLSRYRFTTRESTPDDQSVDPDPERLGRVFENLYQGDARHDTGTYYTPREIVHFMCRQALDGYLCDQTGVSRETLDWLRKQAVEKEEGGKPLPRELEERLVSALELVRVCDPAVGSGAFLLGMMQEMILLRRSIEYSKREDIQDEEQLITDWKRHAIQYSLYGVDINPEAVEICQLRLWLSLVLDLLEPPRDAPLPNLDFRIVAGDSLVDRVADITFVGSWPPKETTVSLELRHKVDGLVTSIGRWRQEFDSTHRNPLRLKDLRDRIGKAQGQIIWLHLEEAVKRAEEDVAYAKGLTARKNALKQAQARVDQLYGIISEVDSRNFALIQKPFLWPIAFPEILAQGNANAGFDIVLANPPYVRQEKLDASDQESYRQAFPEVYAGTADILVFFYGRALQILRPGGWLAFITSNKYMRAAYGEDLRGHMPNTMVVDRILDFGDLPLFEANGKQVAAYPAVVVGHKDEQGEEHSLRVANLTYPVRRKLTEARLQVNPENVRRVLEDLGGLLKETEVPDYPQVLLRRHSWILEDPALVRLFHRLMSEGKPLREYVNGRILYGVKTGLGKAFVINDETRRGLIAEDPRSAELIKPWLRGRDIKRWRAVWNSLYVIFTRRGTSIDDYPAIRDYLMWWRKELEPKKSSGQPGPGRKPGSYKWFELQDSVDYYLDFELPKVIVNRFINSPDFSYDESGLLHNDASFSVWAPTPSIAAILNSRLGWFFLSHLCTQLQNGYIQVFIQFLEQLPVPMIDSQADDHATSLVRALVQAPSKVQK
ncbi:MAG: Eco57I restriction-modification methylase domain-containing protein, partial [Chloroflexi bacterium]|nr:Eco57I restriction-modification methylase domain-containing protein [Chloroflexota bacterium]